VIDCHSTADVDGYSFVGGLVGWNNTTAIIDNCYSEGNVSSNGPVGGLVGTNQYDSVIQNSHSTGGVISYGSSGCGSANSGGLLGLNQMNSVVINCFSSSIVTGTQNVGGLVGDNMNESTISMSYSSGVVTGSSFYVGGLVGNNSISVIDNCYSTATTDGFWRVGGLAGSSVGPGSLITNSYSTGIVTGTYSPGGLVGYVSGGDVINSYWDTETSGQSTSYGGEGRTTSEMTYPYAGNTYVNWDFSETWSEDTGENVNNGYPYLSWQSGEVNPDPNVAINPLPANGSSNVPITLETVSWQYISNPAYTDPVGFRVYMNTTGDFAADDFVWIPYNAGQETYSSSDVIPNLTYETTFYWQVIPTTDYPERDLTNRRNRSLPRVRNTQAGMRGDADNTPVWSFTTAAEPLPPAPATAHSPFPNNGATDVPTDTHLGWTYTTGAGYSNPDGFMVNFWSGDTSDDPIQVDLPGGVGEHILAEPPIDLVYEETYYWQVKPYVNHSGGNVYASNCPIWSFTTLEEITPPVTAHTPLPSDGATSVPVNTPIGWIYTSEAGYSDPDGFLVNMWSGDTGENPFQADIEGGPGEYLFDEHPFDFDYEEIYYWQIVPYVNVYYNDETIYAENCPIWSFTTAEEGTLPPPPATAHSPIPSDGATSVPINTPIGWSYTFVPGYSNPDGYLVNMWTDDMNEDPFQIYIEGGSGVYLIPDYAYNFDYEESYLWQVIPYILHNDEEIFAEDCPFWSFTTALDGTPPPAPSAAHSPIPDDEAANVPVTTPIGWTYTFQEGYSYPDGFLINMWMGGTGDDPVQVELEGGAGEHLYTDHPFDFDYEETYFWQVIPYVNHNDEPIYAEDCPLWSFITIDENTIPQPPAAAHSPIPESGATDVSIDTPLGWTYTSETGYSDPDGFLIKLWCGDINEDPLETEIEGGVGEHLLTEHPFDLQYDETYFWQVIPFVYYKDDTIYAADCPIWSFQTEQTSTTDTTEIVAVTRLRGNYPNPFNPETMIGYTLAEAGMVRIEIFNINGQRIVTLINGVKEAGDHEILWDGKDDAGRRVTSGVYFYRMVARDYSQVAKMLLLK